MTTFQSASTRRTFQTAEAHRGDEKEFMSDIPKTVECLISELQVAQARVIELESENLNMAERISALKKIKVELEETNLNNVANYQLQLAELSAAVVKKDEALKLLLDRRKLFSSKFGRPWEGSDGRYTQAEIALKTITPDALKEYLKETVKILQRAKLSFDEFHYNGLYEDIQKELSRITNDTKP